jgi:hypothetical protein
MDDIKKKESPYSNDLSQIATAERQAEAREIAESLAGRRTAGSRGQAHAAPTTDSPEMASTGGSSPIAELLEFLKQTKRIWLLVVGGILGLVVVFTLVSRAYQWASNASERRHEQAVASVTPESLIARCGQPAEDNTKNVFPILMRTMTYQISRNEAYVFSFSRTAEEKSDWVFLSMKDANGAKSYETPEEKVAAMSCLNSRK